MARSKNATALFEVIHTAKKPPKASPTGGAIPAPKWWAKGSGKSSDRPAAAAPNAPADVDETGEDEPHPEPSGGTRRSWLAAARQSVGQPHPPAADAEAPAEEDAQVYITRIYPPDAAERGERDTAQDEATGPVHDAVDEPEPRQESPVFSKPPAEAPAVERQSWAERRAKVLAERTSSPPSTDPSFDPTADVSASDLRSPRLRKRPAPVDPVEVEEARPTPRPQRMRKSAGPAPSAHKLDVDPAVALDRSAGEVRFRLSYGGAIAAGAILLIVIAIAYLAGRQRNSAESIADGSSSARATSGGGSTDAVAPPSGGLLAAASATAPGTPPEPAAAVTAPIVTTTTAAPAAADDSASPQDPAQPAVRQAGMMYAVVQSYPDRETARRAGAFLNRSGVPCTVVPGLSGFALRDWYSVVGLQAFARGDHSAAEQAYMRQLSALGPKFSTKVYNQFQPQMYTWRADSDTPKP